MVLYVVGWILNFEAAFMLPSCLVACIYQEKSGLAFVAAMVVALVVGIPLTIRKPKSREFYTREGFTSVALGWIVLSIVGAIPFVLSGSIPNMVKALFESVSGFTTTGSSILTDVEVVPRCVLFWRSFTHWIGGMGVLVFIMAVMPLIGGKNINLMRAESPGPSVTKMTSRIKNTAKILYQIYLVMTVIEILLLLIGKMPLFDALTISFGTAGTGGFCIKNASIAFYNSAYIDGVITLDIILFGINFNLYYLILIKDFKQALKSEELRWYLGIIAAAALLICANAYDVTLTLENNLRQSFFQVASIITTTGFATTDFNLWPGFSHSILVLLMFIGACAGSTGGGLKVSRIVIGFKSVLTYLGAFLHPRAVRKVKFEDKDVDAETMHAICVYFIAAIGLFVISVLLVALDGFDLVTTFSAVAATFNNIGPGLGVAGPTSNFAAFSDFSKVVMTMDMLLGRLEVFPMLMLFYPPLWKESIGEARIRRNRTALH